MHKGDIITDRYHLIERLGGGGFGEVWKAEERIAGRTITTVAVKLLSGQVDLDEVHLLAHLSHNHILKYMGTVEDEGKIYLVTELADSDAGSLIEEGRGLPEKDVEGIIRQIVDALRYLHLENVVHRDVKPRNILLVGNVAKLGDVGISKVLVDSIGEHSGKMTFGYAAPEMFSGKVGYKSDVYSLGISAYQLLTGKMPFEGTAANLMMAHMKKPPDIPDWLSDRWKRILKGCLEKDPEVRWSTEQLYDELTEKTARQPIQSVKREEAQTDKMGTPPTVQIKSPPPSKQESTVQIETSPSMVELSSSDVSFEEPPNSKVWLWWLLGLVVVMATLWLWYWENQGTSAMTLTGHSSDVRTVGFSPDGRKVVSGSRDNTIKLWDLSDGKCIKTFTGHSSWVLSVGFSPNGRSIVSGSWDKTVKLWDISSEECIKTFNGHSECVNSVDFSPDGKMIISGSSDNTIKLWEVSTGNCIKTLTGHSDGVNSVSFSSDGRMIVSGSADNTIKLWDVSTGSCIKTLTGHNSTVYSVCFSPDGSKIASGSGYLDAQRLLRGEIKLWDVSTGDCIKSLIGHSYYVWSVGFSPDGRTIVSGSWDETVKVWDVSTGRCIKTLTGHSSTVYSVCFSPDGSTIASGSFDKTVKLWE